ncbi:hypothetical protein IE81DRAFT_350485 [Ceraceosorus guamensis]|uniref:Uncharacterized protein n=1 Tax=Ceraceosorus guamensis TaxID=1522189 RepID=A0A316VP33_9BASI|nr:hypothetical protein IE81DRAFT_350485 [Ceraceosorus guamensis]PWN39080.1 hypothetical protein IE81DRAFT_350485 [Ceraceosorus guamensis]
MRITAFIYPLTAGLPFATTVAATWLAGRASPDESSLTRDVGRHLEAAATSLVQHQRTTNSIASASSPLHNDLAGGYSLSAGDHTHQAHAKSIVGTSQTLRSAASRFAWPHKDFDEGHTLLWPQTLPPPPPRSALTLQTHSWQSTRTAFEHKAGASSPPSQSDRWSSLDATRVEAESTGDTRSRGKPRADQTGSRHSHVTDSQLPKDYLHLEGSLVPNQRSAARPQRSPHYAPLHDHALGPLITHHIASTASISSPLSQVWSHSADLDTLHHWSPSPKSPDMSVGQANEFVDSLLRSPSRQTLAITPHSDLKLPNGSSADAAARSRAASRQACKRVAESPSIYRSARPGQNMCSFLSEKKRLVKAGQDTSAIELCIAALAREKKMPVPKNHYEYYVAIPRSMKNSLDPAQEHSGSVVSKDSASAGAQKIDDTSMSHRTPRQTPGMRRLYAQRDRERRLDALRGYKQGSGRSQETKAVQAAIDAKAVAAGLSNAPETYDEWLARPRIVGDSSTHMQYGMAQLFKEKEEALAKKEGTADVESRIASLAAQNGVRVPNSSRHFYVMMFRKRQREREIAAKLGQSPKKRARRAEVSALPHAPSEWASTSLSDYGVAQLFRFRDHARSAGETEHAKRIQAAIDARAKAEGVILTDTWRNYRRGSHLLRRKGAYEKT